MQVMERIVIDQVSFEVLQILEKTKWGFLVRILLLINFIALFSVLIEITRYTGVTETVSRKK